MKRLLFITLAALLAGQIALARPSKTQKARPGITLQLFDMAFWAQKDPAKLYAVPVYEEVVDSAVFPRARDAFWGEAPTYAKWARIFPKFTQAACATPPGNPDPIPDLVTAMLKGYFLPEADGDYIFTLKCEGDKASLLLGQENGLWKDSEVILSLSGAANVGHRIRNNCYRSEPIRLQKGKAYPLHLVSWFVHGMGCELRVKGPGLEHNPIIPRRLLSTLNPYQPLSQPKKAKAPKPVVQRMTLALTRNAICPFSGLGINADMMTGRLFRDSVYYRKVMNLHPGLLRWGALEANLYAFEQAYGPDSLQAPVSIGERSEQSHARNMDLCNRIGAAYALCVGMKDGNGGFGRGDGKNYTVDYVSRPETFLHLLEYLAGPPDSPYGAKRAGEGFEEPLLTSHKGRLLLELGNESWGGFAHNAPLGRNYRKYGEWCRSIARLLETSPYWSDIRHRVTLLYSGRNVRNRDSYGLNEALLEGDRGELPGVAYSGYLGGNMDYDPNTRYGQDVESYFDERHRQMKANLADMRQKWQQPGAKQIYLYESQVSTPAFFGTAGQGIILLDYLTASLRYGSIYPSVFSMGGGEWRIILDDGRPFVHYVLMQKIDRECRGELMEQVAEGEGAPVGCSVFRDGKNWSILLFSRDFRAESRVKLQLPQGLLPQKATQRTPTTARSDTRLDYSEKTRNIRLKDGCEVSVPPHGVKLIRFEE